MAAFDYSFDELSVALSYAIGFGGQAPVVAPTAAAAKAAPKAAAPAKVAAPAAKAAAADDDDGKYCLFGDDEEVRINFVCSSAILFLIFFFLFRHPLPLPRRPCLWRSALPLPRRRQPRRSRWSDHSWCSTSKSGRQRLVCT